MTGLLFDKLLCSGACSTAQSLKVKFCWSKIGAVHVSESLKISVAIQD